MKRTAVVTLASYVDVEGRQRRGWQGDEIDVHDEHVAAFDAAQAVAIGERVVDSLPEPEPVPVGPVGGEPETTPVESNGEIRVSAPEVGVTGENSETTGVPVNAVPNINGDSCTGGWESTVCYAEQSGDSPPEVQPRTSISSSP